MLLNNQQVTEEIKKEIKIFIEMNENENTTTQNLWAPHTQVQTLRRQVTLSCSQPLPPPHSLPPIFFFFFSPKPQSDQHLINSPGKGPGAWTVFPPTLSTGWEQLAQF